MNDFDLIFRQHTTTVNQISIDDNGDYLASCSDDGRVCILEYSTTKMCDGWTDTPFIQFTQI